MTNRSTVITSQPAGRQNPTTRLIVSADRLIGSADRLIEILEISIYQFLKLQITQFVLQQLKISII
jgi:hypothetical protein